MARSFAALRMTGSAVALLLTFAITSPAFAHPEGFSGLRVQVRADGVRASLTVHTRDMTAWFPPGKYPDYVPQVSPALAAMPDELLEVAFDDSPVPATKAAAFLAETGLIQVDLDYPPPPHEARAIRVWSKHLPHLPRGHQQLLFVVDAGEATVCEATLSSEEDSATCDLPSASSSTQPTTQPSRPPPRRISFFLLGVEHIATGYDHLLFLAAILLVCRTFREAAAVVTFFTVAHSITLSLAALDVVRLPSRVVEPAIAASIVYVGLENLFGKHRLGWRAAVTFGFGLVHGLGFASVLREIGLGFGGVGIAMPLLAFSVGLETGQLCIAAVILRLLLTFKKRPSFDARWVPAGSVLVAMIGLYWL
ncbi:MAG: HupE/UreJ family protein, partial [Planctomycetota bacterium]|nr:HupE/UreJ family protein [Planctomycetota bacterium]